MFGDGGNKVSRFTPPQRANEMNQTNANRLIRNIEDNEDRGRTAQKLVLIYVFQ